MSIVAATQEAEGDKPARSLLGYLSRWADTQGDALAFTFVDHSTESGGTAHSIRWAELDLMVRAAAAHLGALITTGDRVALLMGNGLEYVIGFLAATHAGAIAVPLFDPRLPGHGERLAAVLDDCSPTVVMTTRSGTDPVRAFVAEHATAGTVDGTPPRVVPLDAAGPIDERAAETWEAPAVGGDDIAYLQYTSGSTRTPAGVMITHENVLRNVEQLMLAYGLRAARSRAVSWLPLFHDMGLVTGLLAPVVAGMPSVLMDPMAFVQRPARWLQLLAEHEGAYAAAPNFSFDHCVRRVRERDRAALRLSGVDVLINGSEPVRGDTIERFHTAFGPCGLARETHRPSYGLAEACVFVAAAPGPAVTTYFDGDELAFGAAREVDASGTRTSALVALGRPVQQHIAIVDPHTLRRCADGSVGEIWVHGPNVGQGYWRQPRQSAETFAGTLSEPAGGPATHGWLRTGDLGMVYRGDLYVTGRIKDLVIIDGRNHHPHDIEATVETTHPVIRDGRVAAFAVPADDGERLVVVAEQSSGARAGEVVTVRQLAGTVRRDVAERHGIGVHDFLLVPAGTVPRTSSGKLARQACRQRYLAGELDRIEEPA